MARALKTFCIILGATILSALPSKAGGWARTYGGAQDEFLFSCAVATDGGLLLAGAATKADLTGTTGWAIRTDDAGAILWQKSFGGTKGLRFDAVLAEPDGSFVLAGRTDSFGAGLSDVLLMKVDSEGTLLWARTYGGPNDDMASGLARGADGGYLVAGSTNSYGAGNTDAWLLKTDTSGVLQWQRTYGGGQWDYAYSVLPWNSGILLAGLTYTWGTYGDLWILSLDATGAPVWQKNFGSAQYDGLTSSSAVPTADGGFAVACSTEGYGAAQSDCWILKFSSSGSVEWQKRFGGGDYDDAYALLALADGGFVVGGTTFSYGWGQGDFWLLRLDASGGVVWQKSYGGTLPDECWALAPALDGGIFAAGYTENYGAGRADFLLLKVDDQGILDGACVFGKDTSSTPAATSASGANTSAAGAASTAAGSQATPSAAATSVLGPTCAPTHTCSVSCTASASPSYGVPPLAVHFAGTASAPYCTGTPSYLWDFLDGDTSTEQNPTHSYAASGDYPWVMQVTVAGVPCEKTGNVHVCDFTCAASATPVAGQAPLSAQFHASRTISTNCTGTPVYTWNFGDGTGGAGPDTSHTFAAAGTFTWTCTVEERGLLCAQTGTVAVTEPCTVTCSASAEPSSGPAPLAVSFAASATASNCTGTPAFSWAFGDGGSSQLQNPQYSYGSVGTYTWTLTASVGGTQCTQTGTVSVVEPCTLSCTATVPESARAEDPVSFSASAEAPHCGSAPVFAWTFGDGGSANVQDPSHIYAVAGTFTWTLAVSADGATCTKTGSIAVSEACTVTCSASATPASGDAPLAVAFSGSASATHCSGAPAFAWTFGDGSSSEEQNPAHTYAVAGTYTWTLTATVEGKMCSQTGVVAAIEPCSLSCEAAAEPDHGRKPLVVAFAAQATPAHCAGPPAYEWAFGDGSTSQEQNPSHTYGSAGTFTWTVTASADGATCSSSGSITVEPGVPGDCDGTGEVSIGEVQKAINMFLEILTPGCGVDCNGDGTVSIGEVQKVINAFLGLALEC